MMGYTCNQNLEDKECIQKCSREASWKMKIMTGNWSLKKEVSGIRCGWNWLRTISNSRWYSVFGYLSSNTQLKPTYCLKWYCDKSWPTQINHSTVVSQFPQWSMRKYKIKEHKTDAIVAWIISYKLKHTTFWKKCITLSIHIQQLLSFPCRQFSPFNKFKVVLRYAP